MKSIRAIALLILCSAAVRAQQMASFGLQGMHMTVLAITPSDQGIPAGKYLYAGTGSQGVFRRDLSSTDSSWVSIGLEGRKITALYVYHWGVGPADFNTLFAAVTPDWSKGDSTRLYRYTSEEKWVPSDSGMNRKNFNTIRMIRGLFFSGHEPPRVLFATAGYEMYRSFDAGQHWEASSPGIGFTRALEAHQPSGFAWAGGIFGRDFPLFPWIARSNDQGMTWQSTGAISLQDVTVRSLVAHPRDSSVVYAAVDGYVIKSNDTGETWSVTGLKDLRSRYFALAMDPEAPSHLWVGGEAIENGDWQMAESLDGGNTWASIPPAPCDSVCGWISDLIPQPGEGHAVYIATAGDGVWHYQSRLTPPKVIRVPEDFSTIQTAIDSATAGDTLLVSPGIYVENIDFRGKNVALKSVKGPEKTFIDGDQKGSVVTFAAGEDSTARLEGFTLRNGSGTASTDSKVYGGAIYCASSSPTIVRNVIRDNRVMAGCGAVGGGIAIAGSSAPLIESNHIYGNSVASLCDALINFGGGILISGSATPRLRENTIMRNSADFGGGLAVMDSARPVIQRNIITRNFRGGIVASQLARPVIGGASRTGNDIAGNDGPEIERRLLDATQSEKINAQYNYFGVCPPTEKEVVPLDQFDTSNCQNLAVRTYFPLAKGNRWTLGKSGEVTETVIDTFTIGGQYFFYRFDQFRHIENVALRLTEDNKLTFRRDLMSAIEYTWVDFGAEIGEQWTVRDPLSFGSWLVKLESKTDTVSVPAGVFTECFRFNFSFSGGDNDWIEWYAPGVGPVKRVQLGFAVIEYPLISAVIHDVLVSVNGAPIDIGSVQFRLHPCYPNPFNTETMIGYDVSEPAAVTLEIYNVLGQRVRTLVSGSKPSGAYRVLWDGTDDAGHIMPSGVYYCQFKAGNFNQVRKLALIR